MKALTEKLGILNAERFVAIINREQFDYTEWRRSLFEGMSVEEFLNNAMKHREDEKERSMSMKE
jgi:hypothetical protein